MAPSMQKWAAHRNLWATPKATDAERGGRGDLVQQVRGNDSPSGHFRTWATPRAADGMQHPIRDPANIKDGNARARLEDEVALSEGKPGGSVNPTWVEWLMGFPIGWTDLGPSGTALSRRSRSGSDEGSSSGRAA
jgi:hypothetical protein